MIVVPGREDARSIRAVGSWRRPGGGAGGDPRNLRPEAMHEQQESIERAAREARRRKEAESAAGRSWWQRLRFWFRP